VYYTEYALNIKITSIVLTLFSIQVNVYTCQVTFLCHIECTSLLSLTDIFLFLQLYFLIHVVEHCLLQFHLLGCSQLDFMQLAAVKKCPCG
jgi:hypothetical protein